MPSSRHLNFPINLLLGPFRWNRFRVTDTGAIGAAKPCPFLGWEADSPTKEKEKNEIDLSSAAPLSAVVRAEARLAAGDGRARHSVRAVAWRNVLTRGNGAHEVTRPT